MKTPTTRRAFMAGLAAAPVAALPAMMGRVSEPDPIFAAIERHAAAEIRYCAACRLTDAMAAEQEHRSVTLDDHAEFDAAQRNSDEALDAFLTTAPTTIAGVRAFLRRCIDEESIEPFVGEALETLLRSPALTNNVGAQTMTFAAGVSDPILAAVAEINLSERAYNRAATTLEEAEADAEERLGQHRPSELIVWRDYFIGGSELETRRQALLDERENDPEKIEAEYRDAKKRELAAIRAGAQWDKRAGIAELRFTANNLLQRRTDATESLAKIKPATQQGAAALASFLYRELRDQVPRAHRRMLKNLPSAFEQREVRA